MNVKKRLLATCLTVGLLGISPFSHASESVVYDYTYRDGSAHVYTYNPWQQFEINTEVGYVTDIQLRPDEVVQKISAGNTVQFSVDTDEVAGVQHVYVKPLVGNNKTNFIINTSKRSYRLIVNATDSHEYIILWTYPTEDLKDAVERKEIELAEAYHQNEQYKTIINKQFNENYKVIKNKNVKDIYIPTKVFDDGQKTYIEVRPENQDNFPTIYYFNEYEKNKLELVNYRLKGNYLEIDKIMHGMKLAYSQKSFLIIEKEANTKDVPKAKDITFNKVDAQDLAEAMNGQATTIEMQTEWIPLKERMRKQRINEYKEFVKETQPPEVPSGPANDEALDIQIANLEAELGINNSQNDEAKPSFDEEAERKHVQEQIRLINEGG
ncbi:TrbG/VirB9 family P-type conjugative transfer protein [Veillonella seminalis]|uniref:P-type conjugative transfer protein TrbG n=1 Tax=Veillonella seminalis ACS-216-V-Col6b TaxID=883156 RepID=K9CZH2_9FIRM|nr:TrbG/VirB9 family P-type conjugative transfer protein [Veillonella seminalis]EKU77388.1 hypothetical protein HMPREF9282_02105 [Veillonella seminalis ACS-216-V-Col6b]